MKPSATLPLKAGTSASKGLNKILDADGHVIGEASNYAIDCFKHRDYLISAANAYPTLVQALRDAEHALTREDAQTVHRTGAHDTVTVQALVRARCLLRELGEEA